MGATLPLLALGLAAALLCACGGAPTRSAPAPTQTRDGGAPLCGRPAPGPATELTCRVGARLRARLPHATVRETRPFRIAIDAPGGRALLEARLDAVWSGCEEAPQECDALVDRYVEAAAQVVQQLDAPVAATRDNVRAVLKDAAWASARPDVVSRPFVADLAVVYVVDMPTATRAPDREELEALGLTGEELDRVALRNLEREIRDLPRRPVHEGSRIGAVHAGDSYESSRLLLHERWREVAREVGGDLIVMVPSRDVVLYVSASHAADVEAMRALGVEMHAREPYPVSTTLLRWTEEAWTPFAP